jgi:hypothetical protein
MDLLEHAHAQGHDLQLLLKPVPPTEFLFDVGKMVSGAVNIRRLTCQANGGR